MKSTQEAQPTPSTPNATLPQVQEARCLFISARPAGFGRVEPRVKSYKEFTGTCDGEKACAGEPSERSGTTLSVSVYRSSCAHFGAGEQITACNHVIHPKSPSLAVPARQARVHGARGHLTLCDASDERAELLAGLKRGDEAAAAELFDRFHAHVTRLLSRLLGVDSELPDVVQEVFLRAFRNVKQLRSPEALTTWITRITTFTAMDVLRHRSRRRWLRFVAPETLPDVDSDEVDEEGREAVRRAYQLLERMPVRERVPFTLRKMCGLELTEVAKSCDCSLATVKRRIAAAEASFMAEARLDPILAPRLASINGGDA